VKKVNLQKKRHKEDKATFCRCFSISWRGLYLYGRIEITRGYKKKIDTYSRSFYPQVAFGRDLERSPRKRSEENSTSQSNDRKFYWSANRGFRVPLDVGAEKEYDFGDEDQLPKTGGVKRKKKRY